MLPLKPRFADFFAGSGLVTEGVRHACDPVWANDLCSKKAAIYTANHGTDHFNLGSIERVRGHEVPETDIVWASFPCQDLSLAGRMAGLGASRSGLFWEWLRVLDEMPEPPPVVALENVVGLLSANEGQHYRMIHQALRDRSYRVGPMLIDARHWVPQSRPRVFIVAALPHLEAGTLEDNGPNWLHPEPVRRAVAGLDGVTFWSLPRPARRTVNLSGLIDWEAPVFDAARQEALLALIAPRHRELLDSLPPHRRAAFPGYRRTRNGSQVLELRFDDLSGCLRTAEGGSSRQFLVLRDSGEWKARLITAREAARLMGAPKTYRLSESYNDSYNAMGDAVVVPVVKHLVDHLLVPLATAHHVPASAGSAPRFRLFA